MNYFQSIFFCKLLVETVSKCARKKINIIEYYYVRTREQIEESKSNEWSGEEKNQIKSIAVKYSLQLALFLPPFFHIFRLFFSRKVFSRFFSSILDIVQVDWLRSHLNWQTFKYRWTTIISIITFERIFYFFWWIRFFFLFFSNNGIDR